MKYNTIRTRHQRREIFTRAHTNLYNACRNPSAEGFSLVSRRNPWRMGAGAATPLRHALRVGHGARLASAAPRPFGRFVPSGLLCPRSLLLQSIDILRAPGREANLVSLRLRRTPASHQLYHDCSRLHYRARARSFCLGVHCSPYTLAIATAIT